ncbi:vigilin [Nephila pilipes]|uniref:Vigilin n=1 Tax=Nephila pilipes TaxID=299642 RepID=A0A8X6TPZ5_NEPPI|nr:vigilin [Nephila pilipes]
MGNEISKDLIIEQRFHEKIRDKFNQVNIIFPEPDTKNDKIIIRGPKSDVVACYKYLHRMNEEMKFINFSVKVPIYKQNHKFIIGKGGTIIKKIRAETKTKIDLPVEGAESDIITIHGPKEDVMKSKKRLLEISNEKKLVGYTVEIKANLEQYKFLIRKNGDSIKKVRDKTGARILSPNENDDDKNAITIIGRKEEVKAAKNALNSLITQLKDTAEKTTEIDPKHHRYFVARGIEVLKHISNH